jgi:predicted transposase YbfD/YdcC
MNNVSLLKTFEQLPDPRIERTKKYPLNEIILLIVSAAISGCTGWQSIKYFGEEKLHWLRKFLPFKQGIPADDTIARIVRRLCPQTFNKCFFEWTNNICTQVDEDIIPIDGKTVRGSHDNDRTITPIHVVSAWSDSNSVVLGQEKVDEKSNEITAIPRLLEMLDIKGCIITIDSMGCQKDIAAQILAKKGDYILGLKGNQGNLHDDVDVFFTTALHTEFMDIEHDYHKETDSGHGRIEERECWVIRPSDYKRCFSTIEQWKQLESIIMVKATRHTKAKKTTETRYYISSCVPDSKFLLGAIRKHWGVESMHWMLDVTFGEDQSRIRKGDSAENISILRKIALNAMKKFTSVKTSVAGKIQKAILSDTFREEVLRKVMVISAN